MSDSRYIWSAGNVGVIWGAVFEGVAPASRNRSEIIAHVGFPMTADGCGMALAWAHAYAVGQGLIERLPGNELSAWATLEGDRLYKLGPRKAHNEWIDRDDAE